MVLLLTGCNNTLGVKTIRLAHGLDVNHLVHKAMFKISEDLAKLSIR